MTPGSTVLDAARIVGVIIPAPCGGRGVCGKCAVRVIEGSPEPPDEFERVGLSRAPSALRLACRMRVNGPLTVQPVVAGGSTSSAGESPVIDEEFYAGVDLGTTTVSAVIVGARTGRELGRATVPNAQQSYGMDLVSRITASLAGEARGLAIAAEKSLTDALEAACGAAGACLERISRVVVAGNAAMTALAAGWDVSGLATAPFEAPSAPVTGMELPGLARRLAPGAQIRVVEGLSGFVGGDAVAGLLACGLLASEEDAAFIDIGTNAEIVVRSKGRIAYASVAAGPAFEGFGISSGGPAGPGAITKVREAGLGLDVIGGGEPGWLAGSGLVSAIAVLRRAGHIDASGAMRADGPHSDRFDRDENAVVRAELGPAGSGVYLTQLDVRAFQTAKAAVAAGLLSVARAVKLKPKRVRRFVVAGTFGAALEVEDLVILGVVPEDLADRVEALPDAALTGSAALAFDPSAASDLEQLRSASVRVELATDREFSDLFLRATELVPFGLKKGF